MGYRFIFFSKIGPEVQATLKKPCQILNLNSAKIVNAGRRKMQKMDGWTESQADAEWWY